MADLALVLDCEVLEESRVQTTMVKNHYTLFDLSKWKKTP
jgi:hypothetical protein